MAVPQSSAGSPHGVGPNGESQVNNQRRAALLTSWENVRLFEMGAAGALRAQLLSGVGVLAGTPLPANVPNRAALVKAGYSCVEDFDGASVSELIQNASLTLPQATGTLTALGWLPRIPTPP